MRIDALRFGENPPEDVNVFIEVLVLNTRELIPGCVFNMRPVGVLIMEDQAGQDEKIIAVPSHSLTRRLVTEAIHRAGA
ncbi:MAG TPA: inorganic diphosphatase [Woeseiaceae bacterium]|jgi:inorganic pyrophosphatase|nr:inorganic diphosphatase [Woeseiaceae bacterium]